MTDRAQRATERLRDDRRHLVLPTEPRTDTMTAMATLKIDEPTAECGNCRFGNLLTGKWSVEDGRLVFRADTSPLRSRGPSLGWCGECGAEFDLLTMGLSDTPLSTDDFDALKARERSEDAHW